MCYNYYRCPFDTSTTRRLSARFRLHDIRPSSHQINVVFGYGSYTHKSPFREWARVVDGGDVPLTYLNNTLTLYTPEQMHTAVSA